ncbi:MAG TPA: D-alanine--D-alanine ligase [Candidatus Omnitrophica bacterium]|nr:D-alanine--D-alanine ligase [Candidatus Omnitrophota bacterium]
MRKRFKNIGVMMGGESSEREISLKSGEAVCKALRRRGYNVRELIVNDLKSVEVTIKKNRVDCVFIALHGGFGENGRVQKILEEMRMSYTGSDSKASYLAMNKIESKRVFKECGLPVAPYKIYTANQGSLNLDGLTTPLVVKPSMQGSSVGLSIVENEEEINRAIYRAQSFDSQIIIERYIKGRELTVGILEDKPLPVVEIIPKCKFYDYKAKYTKGLSEYEVPAKLDSSLSKRIQEIGLKAHRALGCCFFSRVDMRLSEDNQVFILEVNSIPGLTTQSLLPKAAASAGISFELLCDKIVNASHSF